MEGEDGAAPRQSKETISIAELVLYLKDGKYEQGAEKERKHSIRRAAKKYTLDNGKLFFMKGGKKLLVLEEDCDIERAIRFIHEGLGGDEASALSAHRGLNKSFRQLSDRYYWPTLWKDLKNWIEKCDACQRVKGPPEKMVPELQSVHVESEVMKQVGVDLVSFPEVDGLRYVCVLIDYFSKWSEAKALPKKTGEEVALFLFEVICRHGCFAIQINDQGREFVNKVSAELHRLTGTAQRVTSAYHPQSNGLVERQNRFIKESLLKVLGNNVERWPRMIEPVLFSHRTSVHSSTKFSPFYLLYNRQAVLPVDLELGTATSMDKDAEFDFEGLEQRTNALGEMRDQVVAMASVNIEKAQEKQKKDYDRRHRTGQTSMKVGDLVLTRNLRRDNRKGGWKSQPWLGPYKIGKLLEKTAQLTSMEGKPLKQSQSYGNLKAYKKKSGNWKALGWKKQHLNTTDDDDPDVDIETIDEEETVPMYTEQSETEDLDFPHTPVDKKWQLEAAELLGLRVYKSHGLRKTIKHLKGSTPAKEKW